VSKTEAIVGLRITCDKLRVHEVERVVLKVEPMLCVRSTSFILFICGVLTFYSGRLAVLQQGRELTKLFNKAGSQLIIMLGLAHHMSQ
jgi:hypothetical protein